jgi:PKD repeat protein
VFNRWLKIESTFDVQIFHNDYVYDKLPHDPGSSEWDIGYPGGGNFWLIYNGYDNFSGPNQDILGSDGIGDINLSIDSDSIDRYPLIDPFNDVFPPEIELISPENHSIIKPGVNIDFEISDLKIDYVNCSINGDPELPFQPPYDIDTSNWTDKIYEVLIKARDVSNNYAFKTFFFTIDSEAPIISLNSPEDNSAILNGTILDFSINDTHLLEVEYSRNYHGYNPISYPFNISTLGWQDGYYIINIKAKDVAGNQNISRFDFTIDSIQPFFHSASGDLESFCGDLFVIYANFTDNINVRNATIYYRNETNFWKCMAMTKDLEGYGDEPDVFSINSTSLGIFTLNNSSDWYFFINVTDGLFNVSHGNYTNYYTIQIIDNIPPIANAGTDQIVNEDTLVIVFASGSRDNNGSIGLSYAWDWDSENGISKENITFSASHIYDEPGIYTITLNVIDLYGNWDTDTLSIIVRDITPPVADAGQDITVVEDEQCDFFGNKSFDNKGITELTLIWTFLVDDTLVILHGIQPLYYFENPGVYNVTLNVTDAEGNWGIDQVTVLVLVDTDSDGNPDIEDQDDDNDGYDDIVELSEGTDTLDSESRPADNDGDFIPDSTDPDDDNDEVPDDKDDFPLDPNKWKKESEGDFILYILVIVILVIISLILLMFFIKRKKGKGEPIEVEPVVVEPEIQPPPP